jgi:predicted secreted protein
MKTKSTVGRLITHLSKWRESGNQKWRESGARVAGTDTATERAQETRNIRRESGGYAALTLHHRSTRMGRLFMEYDKG